MIEKNGIVTFECDKDKDGNEIGNSSQRNNELVWPSETAKPKAQYRTSWKNMCNVTSYVMGLEYSGFIFPSGKYKQPEDNLGYHILTSPTVLAEFKKRQPAMYNLFIKSLEGGCNKAELDVLYFPTELHDYLSMGANEWIGTKATRFSQNINFKKALWRYMVEDNLPMVISTNFGGFGHIVCVTGVQYNKAEWEKGVEFRKENLEELPEITPVSIIIDDPWGKYNPKTNKYDAPSGGNDLIIPWERVVASVKPYNSEKVKWAHTFSHAVATV